MAPRSMCSGTDRAGTGRTAPSAPTARRRLAGPFFAAPFLAALALVATGTSFGITGARAADDFLRLAVVPPIASMRPRPRSTSRSTSAPRT